MGRICLLKNSFHIFDVEKVVQDYIGQQTFVDDDRTLDIYRFATSHDEPGIQISDVIAGLLGESSFQSCNAANLKSLPSCAAASTRSKSTILPC